MLSSLQYDGRLDRLRAPRQRQCHAGQRETLFQGALDQGERGQVQTVKSRSVSETRAYVRLHINMQACQLKLSGPSGLSLMVATASRRGESSLR